MSAPAPKCPKCGSIIYSRRNVLCGVCGERLPDELLFTPAERAAVEHDLKELNQRDKEWREAQARRPFDSGPDIGGYYGL